MPDDLHVARQGPPRSGEVIITDTELHGDDPAWREERMYTEIARRFFAQFLALKTEVAEGRLYPNREHEKELAGYRKMNEQLKKSIKDYIEQVEKAEESLALADEENKALQARVNALIIEVGMAQEKLQSLGLVSRDVEKKTGVPFRELMSEESRREWDRLMKEIPRPGTGK